MKTNNSNSKSLTILPFPIVLLLLATLIMPIHTTAQIKAFLIHEDQVTPDKYNDYVSTSKDFKALCEKHNFSESWSVAQMDNGTFLTISAIEKFADLDKNPMADLAKEVGADNFQKHFDKFDECYDKHGSYISLLNEELSYMPEGMNLAQEGENYRRWIFMETSARNVDKVKEKIMNIKTLFAKKNSKMYYRIYQNGFGYVGDRFVVVISAKNALDYEQKSDDNRKLLGEESRPLFDELYNLLSAHKEISGRMRPDLGYTKN